MQIIDLTDPSNAAASFILVSDTHGHVDERITDLASACDFALHLGDIGSAAVLEQLQPKSRRVFAVTGNNDTPAKWDAEDVDVLQRLPRQLTLKLPCGDLVAEHGDQIRNASRYHELLRKKHPFARVIAFGHTHRRVIDTSETPWVVNPGASGRNRTYGGPSCLILRQQNGNWSFEEYVLPLHD